MKKLKSLITCLLVNAFLANVQAQIKVACVGNSITYGFGIADRENYAYPALLQTLLGKKYQVNNYGVSGTTLLIKGNSPYRKTVQYFQALASKPDIVLIKLGTNDSKLINRGYLNEFVSDYRALIRSFSELSSNPRIILLLPVPSFMRDTAQIWDPVLNKRILPLIQQTAYVEGLEVINLRFLLIDKPELFPDKIHPSAEGAMIIAKRLSEVIKTKPQPEFDAFAKLDVEKKISSFQGYPCADFIFEGRACKVVKPKHASFGHPWIWRARFWNVEPQTEIALLERGYHVVYCDVAELFGNAEAIRVWNGYYELMQSLGLGKKAVLEGMSRGGVYDYNWAAVNPEKVTCIYADNPVMDLKSWPGGKGKGPGSTNDWAIVKRDFNLKTPEEEQAFSGSPIDQVAKITAGNYPMLHVLGDADEVVPPEENTLPFAEKVQALHGNLTIIHKPGFKHHPHSLPDPTPIVEFILNAVGRP